MTPKPTLFGASYSVYVRIAQLVLLEKGVPYSLVPVDVFAPEGVPIEHLNRHPFGRIPAFEHAGLMLYETSAITRFVDEAFEGPPLQPVNPIDRARCNQLISIADNDAYPQLVWGIYVELCSKPDRGEPSDPKRVASAIAGSKTCLQAMESLLGHHQWLVGSALSLADLHAAPMFAYLQRATEGRKLLLNYPRLGAWWRRMSERNSMHLSEPDATAAPG